MKEKETVLRIISNFLACILVTALSAYSLFASLPVQAARLSDVPASAETSAGSSVAAGGQLRLEDMDMLPLSAQESTPDNPLMTIQHYYRHSEMSFQELSEADYLAWQKKQSPATSYKMSNSSTEAQKKLYAYYQNRLTVWNAAARNGDLPQNTPSSSTYAQNRSNDPLYEIQFENGTSGKLKTEETIHRLFADDKVHYFDKPDIRYMNKLYDKDDSDEAYNSHYRLKQIWLTTESYLKAKGTTVDTVNPAYFTVLDVPTLSSDSSYHDPSRILFTNNASHRNFQNGRSNKKETGVTCVQDDDKALTVLVEDNELVIRLLFLPSQDTSVEHSEVNIEAEFYDYDITSGCIYTSEAAAKNDANGTAAFTSYNSVKGEISNGAFPKDKNYKFPTSYQQLPALKNQVWYVRTNRQGVNSYAGAVYAFGNSNTQTGLGLKTWNEYTLNAYNSKNAFSSSANKGPNLQGTTFQLTNGLKTIDGSTNTSPSNITVSWASGIPDPQIFQIPSSSRKGITYFPDSSESGEEWFSLGFNRSGDTYILQNVSHHDSKGTSLAASNLDQLTQMDHYAHIKSNNFWPMDAASTFGQDGHDFKFGEATWGTSSAVKSEKTNAVGVDNSTQAAKTDKLPPSDDLLYHNSYFGMKLQIPFTLEEGYAAPLHYFFYGDDDMYVYLSKCTRDENGNIISIDDIEDSVLIADVGGVHSSAGMYISLWDYIADDEKELIETRSSAAGHIEKIYKYTGGRSVEGSSLKKQDYVMSIFYTERGASGSSCYLRYSIPFISATNQAVAHNGNLKVEKNVQTSSASQTDSDEEYIFSFQVGPVDISLETFNNAYEVAYYGKDGQLLDIPDSMRIQKPARVSNGSCFTLKSGEYAWIKELPQTDLEDRRYLYRVEETGLYNPDYIAPDTTGSDPPLIRHCQPLDEEATTFRTGLFKVDETGQISEELNQHFLKGNAYENEIGKQNYLRFINVSNPGMLQLEKLLTGQTDHSPDGPFAFTLTLKDKDGHPITDVPFMNKGISLSSLPDVQTGTAGNLADFPGVKSEDGSQWSYSSDSGQIWKFVKDEEASTEQQSVFTCTQTDSNGQTLQYVLREGSRTLSRDEIASLILERGMSGWTLIDADGSDAVFQKADEKGEIYAVSVQTGCREISLSRKSGTTVRILQSWADKDLAFKEEQEYWQSLKSGDTLHSDEGIFEIALSASQEILLYDLPLGTQWSVAENLDPVEDEEGNLYAFHPAELEITQPNESSTLPDTASAQGQLPAIMPEDPDENPVHVELTFTNEMEGQVDEISLTKTVAKKGEYDSTVLEDHADLEYRFRLLKSNGEELFLPPGSTYRIGENEYELAEDGIFFLKAGQTAYFRHPVTPGEKESYIVEELIPEAMHELFFKTELSDDGSSWQQMDSSRQTIDGKTYTALRSSPVQANQSRKISLTAKNTFETTGSFTIQKLLAGAGYEDSACQKEHFTMSVELKNADGSSYQNPVPVTIEGQTREMTPDSGGSLKITLCNTQKAILEEIPAGISYCVTELNAPDAHAESDAPWTWFVSSSSSGLTGKIEIARQMDAAIINIPKGNEDPGRPEENFEEKAGMDNTFRTPVWLQDASPASL